MRAARRDLMPGLRAALLRGSGAGASATPRAAGVPAPLPSRMRTSRLWTSPPSRSSEPAPLASEAAAEDAEYASPVAWYEAQLVGGELKEDIRQRVAIDKLQRLFDELLEYRGLAGPQGGPREAPGGTGGEGGEGGGASPAAPGQAASSVWSRLSGLLGGTPAGSAAGAPGMPSRPAPRGLYMYGGVGVGKTMLMDAFADASPDALRVRRTHFHDFMLGVHSSLRRASRHRDPLGLVAEDILATTSVLCLDELFVTDVADAMLLARLFEHLWSRDMVLVATSNRAPKKLYENGLQRALFLPFIAQLEARCDCHDMDSPVDYRVLAKQTSGRYFVGEDADILLEGKWTREEEGEDAGAGGGESTSGRDAGGPAGPAGGQTLRVAMGRELTCRRATRSAAYFTFSELCDRPLGAADYIALARAKHTLFLEGVPIVSAKNRSAAYRFVTLVDVMYEHRAKVVLSAEATPLELFRDVVTYHQSRERPTNLERAVVDDNLGFAKDRTISRLTEMQSEEYEKAHAEAHATHHLDL